MLRSIKQLACSIAALTVIGAGSAHAQADCPRGELDKAYCDRNGDLVADAPTDPKQLVNPSTLIFAYTPVEDPAVYTKVWDGFIKHAEKVTGKKVVFFRWQSNAAEIEAMRSGRIRLHRKEHDLFAGDLFRVLDESVPHLCIDRRVFNRRIRKDQRRRIDE